MAGRVTKLAGPALIVAITAAATVFENARSHGPSPIGLWLIWLGTGVVCGVLVAGFVYAVFAPLAWLARQLRPRP